MLNIIVTHKLRSVEGNFIAYKLWLTGLNWLRLKVKLMKMKNLIKNAYNFSVIKVIDKFFHQVL